MAKTSRRQTFSAHKLHVLQSYYRNEGNAAHFSRQHKCFRPPNVPKALTMQMLTSITVLSFLTNQLPKLMKWSAIVISFSSINLDNNDVQFCSNVLHSEDVKHSPNKVKPPRICLVHVANASRIPTSTQGNPSHTASPHFLVWRLLPEDLLRYPPLSRLWWSWTRMKRWDNLVEYR